MRFIAAFFILLSASCNYNHVKVAAPVGSALTASQISTPDFKTIQGAVLGPRCLGCHSSAGGNSGGTNLEQYGTVRSLLSRIAFRTLEKKDMPPRGALSAMEAQLLQNWIDSGAPETVATVGEKPDPNELSGPNDWAKVRDKIFAKKCSDCHSGATPDAGLDTTDLKQVRAKVLAIFDRVVVKGDMPVAPYPAMTPKERKILLQWFDSGLPE